MAIRPLTEKGIVSRTAQAVLIAERWYNAPRSDVSQLAVKECSRNGGLAAAVILQLHEQHGSVVALKYTRKIAQYGRTNAGTVAE